MPLLDSMSKVIGMLVGIVTVISLILGMGGYAWLQREIPFLPQISTSPLPVILPTPAPSVSTSPPPPYAATIWSWDQDGWLSLPITMDGVSTGFSTPHTFQLTGTHTFTFPSTDSRGYAFTNWSTGQTSTTITVSSGGTFTARYGRVPAS